MQTNFNGKQENRRIKNVGLASTPQTVVRRLVELYLVPLYDAREYWFDLSCYPPCTVPYSPNIHSGPHRRLNESIHIFFSLHISERLTTCRPCYMYCAVRRLSPTECKHTLLQISPLSNLPWRTLYMTRSPKVPVSTRYQRVGHGP